MAANSFVIDPELLTQAKTYAKQAAEENMESYNRMGTLIDQLSEAISGMGDALAGGIQNNRIVDYDINEALEMTKDIDEYLYKVAYEISI